MIRLGLSLTRVCVASSCLRKQFSLRVGRKTLRQGSYAPIACIFYLRDLLVRLRGIKHTILHLAIHDCLVVEECCIAWVPQSKILECNTSSLYDAKSTGRMKDRSLLYPK